MSNPERLRQLKILRHEACGTGARALKFRVNELVKAAPWNVEHRSWRR
jgi:hypothetical protein